MFKKRECKHCKLSKAVANDAAVQFNKAKAELNDMKFHGALLSEENKRLNEELKKWKHWWYLEKKAREKNAEHVNAFLCSVAIIQHPETVNYFGNRSDGE